MIPTKPMTQRIEEMLAMNPTMIHVAVNGVWSANMGPTYEGGHPSSMFSYEKLDYHTGCREFLQGLKDAGIPFTFHGSITL